MSLVQDRPLSAIADVVRGVTFSKKDASTVSGAGLAPVLRAGNIQNELLLDGGLIFVSESKISEKQRLRAGDIVMCTSSGSADIVGKTAYLSNDWKGSFGAFCAVVRPKNAECSPRYLFHYLQSPGFRNWTRNSSGINIKNIRISELGSVSIPLLPVSEQRRIATILDKADAIRRKREHALTLADDLLKSAFMEMFGDLESNPLAWRSKPIAEILATDPQNGLYRPSKDYGSGVRILRIDGFYDGYITQTTKLKRLRIDKTTISKYSLVQGDIVINRVNSKEYLGKSALVEGLDEETVFESNMMRFSAKTDEVDPRFLVDQLQTNFIKRQIMRASKDAVNQSSINQTDVKAFEIRLPPIDRQKRYSELVRSKANAAIQLSCARSEADQLFASLSQRAFRGEL